MLVRHELNFGVLLSLLLILLFILILFIIFGLVVLVRVGIVKSELSVCDRCYVAEVRVVPVEVNALHLVIKPLYTS